MTEEKANKITINDQPIEITAKRLTFFDIQEVAPLFTNAVDFSQYWRYAFANWLSYNPSIDVMGVSPEDGKKLTELLPDPNQVLEWLVFHKPKSDTLSTLSTVDQSQTDFGTNGKGWNTF